jgi:hypothetical protein
MSMQPNFVRDWNKSHPAIRLIIATPEEFFEHRKELAIRSRTASLAAGCSHDIEETTFAKLGARARSMTRRCWPRAIWRAGPAEIRNRV